MTHHEYKARLSGLLRAQTIICSGQSPRIRPPAAELLVEFYESIFGNVRAVVDGVRHDRRENISWTEFIRRVCERDEYHEAMTAIIARSEFAGMDAQDFVRKCFREKFPKWDIVVRAGKPVAMDINEIAWEGYHD